MAAFDPQTKGGLVLITGRKWHFGGEHCDHIYPLWPQGKYFSVEQDHVRYHMVMPPGLEGQT